MEQEDGEPWFIMLETVREYALERFASSGEMELMRHVHAQYYLSLVETAASELIGPQQEAWLARLEREHDNLRATMRWLLEQGGRQDPVDGWEQALRFAGALWVFWYTHAPIEPTKCATRLLKS